MLGWLWKKNSGAMVIWKVVVGWTRGILFQLEKEAEGRRFLKDGMLGEAHLLLRKGANCGTELGVAFWGGVGKGEEKILMESEHDWGIELILLYGSRYFPLLSYHPTLDRDLCRYLFINFSSCSPSYKTLTSRLTPATFILATWLATHSYDLDSIVSK